jgi:nicotinamide riboside kinase
VIRVCFHGAESTGKSVLAGKLARELGCPLVGEYGRE